MLSRSVTTITTTGKTGVLLIARVDRAGVRTEREFRFVKSVDVPRPSSGFDGNGVGSRGRLLTTE